MGEVVLETCTHHRSGARRRACFERERLRSVCFASEEVEAPEVLRVREAGFLEAESVRNVTHDVQAAASCSFLDARERFGGHPRVDLHAVYAEQGELLDGSARLHGIPRNDRVWPHGRVAIDKRPARHHTRPDERSLFDAPSEVETRSVDRSGLAHARHTVEQEQEAEQVRLRQELHLRGKVHVHVDEAGQHVRTGPGMRCGLRALLRGRSNPANAVAPQHDASIRRSTETRIHDGDSVDHDLDVAVEVGQRQGRLQAQSHPANERREQSEEDDPAQCVEDDSPAHSRPF